MGTTTGAAALLGIAVVLQLGYLVDSSAPILFINANQCHSGQIFTFTNANYLRISLENGTCNSSCEIHIFDSKKGSMVEVSVLNLTFPGPNHQGQCVSGAIQMFNGVTRLPIASPFCGTAPAKFSPLYLSQLIIKVSGNGSSGSCDFTFLILYRKVAPGPNANPNPGTAGRIAGIVGGLLAGLIMLALLIWLIVACIGGPARVNWVLVRQVRRFTGPPVMKPPPPPRRPLPPIILKIIPPAWRPPPAAPQPAPQVPAPQPARAPNQPFRFGPLNLNIVLRHRPQLYLPPRQMAVQERQMDFGMESVSGASSKFETRSAHMKIEDVSTVDGRSTIREARDEVRSAHMDLESEYDELPDHMTLGPESTMGTVAGNLVYRSGRIADTSL